MVRMNRHRRRSKVGAIVLLIVMPVAVYAQESERDGFFARLWQRRIERIAATDTYHTGARGAAVAPVQDLRLTSQIYPFLYWTSVSETRTYRDAAMTRSLLSLQIGTPSEERFLTGDSLFLGGIGSYAWNRTWQLGPFPLAVGAGGIAQGHLRLFPELVNDSLSLDGLIAATGAVRVEHHVTLFGRDTRLSLDAAVPLYSWFSRVPEFNIGGLEQRFAPAWELPALWLDVGLSRLMNHSDENRWDLTYRYTFYAVPVTDDGLTVASHAITFGRALKSM